MKQKNLIAFFIMSLGIAVLSLLLPWWSSIIWIIFICVALNLNLRSAWWISGISMTIVWLAASVYFKSQDQTDLIGRTGGVLGGISGSLLVIVTTLIGFISGALSGWFGAACAYLLHGRIINDYTQNRIG